MKKFVIRSCRPEDRERLQVIRELAFRPIYDGFREQLGNEIYAEVRAEEEQKQAAYLDTLMAAGDRHELHVLLNGETVAGFISVTVDEDGVGGEIGLNAIDPAFQGHGGGRLMYEFALDRLKALSVQLARVGTGLDNNHAAARRAYKAVGFERSLSWTVLYKRIS